MGKHQSRLVSAKDAGLKSFQSGGSSKNNPYLKAKGRNKDLHKVRPLTKELPHG